MRLVFMGTPDFAVPSLQALLDHGFDVAAVITQPDRPVGRGGTVRSPPVKVAALRAGLVVLQPPTLRASDALTTLRAIGPDLIVVVAFGQILRRAVLDLPPLGCLNVHPSLLPKLRGAAPIQAAIQEGLSETGVTIMLMNEGMDAGPILSQITAPIFGDDTAATLGDRLARLGADLLVDVIPRWQAGAITPSAQNDAEATFCRPLRKEDAWIDWSTPAERIARVCRAQTPWPGCQTTWDGRQIRLLAVRAQADWTGPEPPGTAFLLPTSPGHSPALAVATGQGALIVEQLQLAGKKPLLAAEFLRGQPRLIGARLGIPLTLP
ncbi:MAG TPA: methionyl-tRNA formyltransferase [Chloroflexota bacterium]|nr:methionyl-tRNA formyltransferase [Chloroflexota bacterium]